MSTKDMVTVVTMRVSPPVSRGDLLLCQFFLLRKSGGSQVHLFLGGNVCDWLLYFKFLRGFFNFVNWM